MHSWIYCKSEKHKIAQCRRVRDHNSTIQFKSDTKFCEFLVNIYFSCLCCVCMQLISPLERLEQKGSNFLGNPWMRK